MFLTILIVTTIFLVLFLIQRYRKQQMAALVAWIIGSIVSNKTAEEEPSNVNKPNRKNKKNLRGSSSKNVSETSKQALYSQANYATNKSGNTEIKTKKHQPAKEFLNKQQPHLDELQNQSLNTTQDIKKVALDVSKPIQIKQDKSSKKKKISKSADKLQSLDKIAVIESSKTEENQPQTLNIQKSKSLPNFQKPIEGNQNKRSKRDSNKEKTVQASETNPELKVNKEVQEYIKPNQTKPLKQSKALIDAPSQQVNDNNIPPKVTQLSEQKIKKGAPENLPGSAKVETSKQASSGRQSSPNKKTDKPFLEASDKIFGSNKELKKTQVDQKADHKGLYTVTKVEITKDFVNKERQHLQTSDRKSDQNLSKLTKAERRKEDFGAKELPNKQEKNFLKLGNEKEINFKENQFIQQTNKKILFENVSQPNKVVISKEAITSSELEKHQKLRKIQSETELTVKKQVGQAPQNKLNLDDVSKLISEKKLHLLQLPNEGVDQKEQGEITTSGVLFNLKAKEQKLIASAVNHKGQIDEPISVNDTVIGKKVDSLVKESLVITTKAELQNCNNLKQDKDLKAQVNSTTPSFQNNNQSTSSDKLIQQKVSAKELLVELQINKEVGEIKSVSTSFGIQSELKVTTESDDNSISKKKIELAEGTTKQETTTKIVDNLPPSAIIEHYKSQYKSLPQVKDILLEASTGITSTLVSNTQADSPKISSDLVSDISKPFVIEKDSVSAQTTSENLFQEHSNMKILTQTRILTLNDNEHQESTLYRIEKNWVLQFRLGPSLLGRKVALYCNYPEQKNVSAPEFDRNKYYLLPWSQDEGCQNSDDTALFTQLTVKTAGSFHYYFIYENATESGPQGSGYFLVDPVLKYGKEEELPLNCIQCQTVLSKCLGPLSTWKDKLRVSKESGYNMIHFTPIQELGKSNSAYSLSGQLKLNPTFNENSTKVSFEDIEKLTSKMRTEWKVLSICDIVLNHTANETDWLQEHPEGTYNCFTCPYMRPAYLLDAALAIFSEDVKNGFYETMGIPPEVSSEDHLNSIRYSLQTKVLKEINLPEMYICDTNKLVSEFQDLARKTPASTESKKLDQKLKINQDPTYRRLASTVDMSLALKLFNVYRQDTFDDEARIKRCSEDFKNELDKLNNNIINEVSVNLNAAVENVIAGMRYFRVQHDGPKIREISIKNPLCARYFTDYGEPKTLKEYEDVMYGTNSKYLMAHNGWVMNADPMRNFADSDSNVYIRRELIAWGDSVKLRFGDKPEDCPFLWNLMKNYVELTAKIFDGVRLDNCHSTPIPVAEYLLDCARKVRPDLYVVAELFTNSDHTDNIFVNRLGITSLIREAMSAWDSHEEGRLVYRYGGDPVGAFFQPHSRPLAPSIAHALFLDLTHDNPSPIAKRSVFDLLPSSALVNMACCASGSNRGYDELVNHHIHVVDEERQYTEWTNDLKLALENPRYVSHNSGIIFAKKCINDLHFKLGKEGFSQVYVDQMDPDIVAVTRHHPQTHESVILVAFTAFGHPSLNAANYQRGIKVLRVEGVLDEIILEATLTHISAGKGGSKYAHPENFVQDEKWINGLSEYQVEVKQHIQLNNSDVFELANSGDPNITQLNFKNFKPGSIVAIRVSLQKQMQDSISKLRDMISALARRSATDLSTILDKLDLADLNRALYRCDQEERDEGHGFSTYCIPNFGSLVYCGLQGFISLLSTIRPSNDLGHPMCGNLRDGNWMIDYICQRLKLDDDTKHLGQWIDKNTQPLKNIPRYLVPSYFDVIVTSLYMLLLEQSYHLMADFVKNGSTFVKGLSLGSLQFAAVIKSAGLPLLSPNLAPPKPLTRIDNHGELVQECVTLSAGLPHFSVGYMRNWGRDTFIALRGLFILTGRFEDARYHILGYAACLRHGLIPNLLDGGKNPRFNCRDAVWWWLYCIKSYVEEAPNGIKIFSDKVSRIFPTDDSPPVEPGVADQPLYEVIQESLRIHFQGLTFRERNAGRQIDEYMQDKGFNNQIGVHPETGFVFGGNEFNCGTWMDKMGSSDKAGIRGKPATPRDGSAVELIGLSKGVITWLAQLHKTNQYPYDGVERVNKNGGTTKWTFSEWSEKIQNSFEKYFWINTSPSPGEIRPDLINKRGIYKDSFGATQQWADFQLRCNFPVAMVAAPELFNPEHAWIALQKVEKHLLGPLGMKTLDPDDWAYCGDYNNSDDSENPKTAHGFNYHQGPEWVWPMGYYLRAKLHFAAKNGELVRTLANVKVILSKHFTELQTSLWRGLPELTNTNGSYCNDSSRTQAWSMSCILEVLHDLQQIELRQHHLKSK